MLLEWKAKELSAEDIAYTLRFEHDLKISSATVLRWIAIAEAEARQEGVAS